MKHEYQAVVIGVSAGGFKALHTILPLLSDNFPAPVVIVQHRMEGEEDYLVESLKKKCSLSVKEAEDKEKIENGVIYIAPGGYHLLIENELLFSLSVDEPVCHARPSIDVLFETAAHVFGSRLVGIVLTGANSDGSNGVRSIKAGGGLTIAQDPHTAEVAYMPRSAIETNCIDRVMNLYEIPTFLNGLLEARHG